jgi:hypothetical protein
MTVSHFSSMLLSTLKYLYSFEPVRMHFPAKQPYCTNYSVYNAAYLPLKKSLFKSAEITVSHFSSMLPSTLKYLYSVEPVRMHFPAKQPCTNDTVCNAAYFPLTKSLFKSTGMTVSHFSSMLLSTLKYLYSVEPIRMHFPAKQPCTNDTVCNAA